MTVLIGLSGRRGAGKDAAFGFIEQWASQRGVRAVRRGFADKLKLSAMRVFYPEIEVEEAVALANTLKSDPFLAVGVISNEPDQDPTHHGVMSGRQFLQRYGTEAHRDVFGSDFWVDALLPLSTTVWFEGSNRQIPIDDGTTPAWTDNFDHADIAVITDCRFVNEAERIRALGGVVWEIHRETGIADSHASEVPLPQELLDRTIYNVTTLDTLRRLVLGSVKELLKETAGEPA